MTPFGAKLRDLRRSRGVSLKEMADAVGVSAAYLSALEHGHRGKPTFDLVQRLIGYFNIIWGEADELVRIVQVSHPRIVVDTAGLSPRATELANRLALSIHALAEQEIDTILAILDEASHRPAATR